VDKDFHQLTQSGERPKTEIKLGDFVEADIQQLRSRVDIAPHVLAMISQGFPNKRISRTLAISPETVKSHVKRVFSKLAASTRTEAVSRAGSLGLL
jgi:DNA-binding NarL/FixJ family response regulator